MVGVYIMSGHNVPLGHRTVNFSQEKSEKGGKLEVFCEVVRFPEANSGFLR
jgi:hypothetical protein